MKNLNSIVIILATAVLISGCSTVQNNQKQGIPKNDVTNVGIGADSPSKDGTNLAPIKKRCENVIDCTEGGGYKFEKICYQNVCQKNKTIHGLIGTWFGKTTVNDYFPDVAKFNFNEKNEFRITLCSDGRLVDSGIYTIYSEKQILFLNYSNYTQLKKFELIGDRLLLDGKEFSKKPIGNCG